MNIIQLMTPDEQREFNYLRDNHTTVDALIRLGYPSVTRNVLRKFFLMSMRQSLQAGLLDAVAKHRLLTDQDVMELLFETKDPRLLTRHSLAPTVFQQVFTNPALFELLPSLLAHPDCPTQYLISCLNNENKEKYRNKMYIFYNMKAEAIKHRNLPEDRIQQLSQFDLENSLARLNSGFNRPELDIFNNPRCPRSLLSTALDLLRNTYHIETRGNQNLVRVANKILANPNCDPQELASINILETFKSGSRLWEGAIINPKLPVNELRSCLVVDEILEYLVLNQGLSSELLLEIALKFDFNSSWQLQQKTMEHPQATLKVLLLGVMSRLPYAVAYGLQARHAPPWLYQLVA